MASALPDTLGAPEAPRAPFRFGRLTQKDVVAAIEQLEEALEEQRLNDAEQKKDAFNAALAASSATVHQCRIIDRLIASSTEIRLRKLPLRLPKRSFS